jgi:hypothetical protein
VVVAAPKTRARRRDLAAATIGRLMRLTDNFSGRTLPLNE